MMYIIAPAHDKEAARSAVAAGADAVWFKLAPAGKGKDKFFSTRDKAPREAAGIISRCLVSGTDTFLNIADRPVDSEFDGLTVRVCDLLKAGLTGVITRDAGVLKVMKSLSPNIKVHIAPEAGTATAREADMWKSLGADMVWLPSALSKERAAYIARYSGAECGAPFGASCGYPYCRLGGGRGCSEDCAGIYGIDDKPKDPALLFREDGEGYWDELVAAGIKAAGIFPVGTLHPDKIASLTKSAALMSGRAEFPKRAEITARCYAGADGAVKVELTDGAGRKAVVSGERIRRGGESVPAASINTQLYNMQNTPYKCVNAECSIEGAVNLSAISALRDRAAEKLSELRALPPNVSVTPYKPAKRFAKNPGRPLVNVKVRSFAQLSEALANLRPDVLYVPVLEAGENAETLRLFESRGSRICAYLPRGCGDGERGETETALNAASETGIKEICVSNLGYLPALYKRGFAVRTELGAEAFNSETLGEYRRMSITSAALSPSLTPAQIAEMSHVCDTELPVYGRLPELLSERCLMREGTLCNCDNPKFLIAEDGSRRPIVRGYGCRSEVFGAKKLFMGHRLDELNNLGLWAISLLFTTENARECVQVTERYKGIGHYAPGEFFQFPVEN